jgi:hypothetical protein
MGGPGGSGGGDCSNDLLQTACTHGDDGAKGLVTAPAPMLEVPSQ